MSIFTNGRVNFEQICQLWCPVAVNPSSGQLSKQINGNGNTYSSVLNGSHVATISNMSFIWVMSLLQIQRMGIIWIHSFSK